MAQSLKSMIKQSLLLGSAFGAMIIASPGLQHAQAQDDERARFSFMPKASTLGIGGDFGVAFTRKFGMRAGLYGFEIGASERASGIEYDLEASLLNAGVFLDYHPFENGFFFSGGMIINDNKIDGQAVDANSFNIGGTSYTLDEIGTLSGEVTTNSIMPYLGVGYGGSVGRPGLSFNFEAGLAYQGSPEASLFADIPADSPLNLDPALLAAFNADLAAEEIEFQDEVASFNFYPVISLGLTWRF